MITRKDIDLSKPVNDKQKKMLELLQERPVQPDEDCPELTEEQLAQFRRVSDIRREERNKQSITIRLSPQAIKTAKSLGKGYTSVLSRILEAALSDSETIKHFL